MAEDLWERQLYECYFGGVRLDVQSTSDTGGRVVATHQIVHREGAPVRDQGAEPRVTQCRIIFFPLDVNDDPRERFFFFKALVDEGKTQTFDHPITGKYRAKCGSLTWSAAAEPRETIAVECSFHEDSDIPAAFEAGPGAPSLAGVDQVAAASAELDDGLVEVNDELLALDDESEPLTSTVGAESIAQVQSWETAASDIDTGISAREINLQLVAISDAISRETDRLELATHPERQPIARSLANLHYSVRRAASAFIEASPRIIEITIVAPTNIYSLAAASYPGEPVEQRVEQLLQLNDIANPARLEAGTRIKAYSARSSPRLRSPRLSARSAL
jgi:hypothetical protein